MTLDRDREKNLRRPMRRGTLILIVASVVFVLAFVFITLAITGQSLF